MRLRLDAGDLEALLAIDDYRAFIKKVMRIRSRSGVTLTYAKLGRLAGISSRSYPRDIVGGTKRMTPALLPKFARALGLTGDLRALFTDLVELSEPGARASGRSEEQIRFSLQRLRARLAQKTSSSFHIEQAFAVAELPRVYAALGTQEQGASQTEIERRTGLDEVVVAGVLAKMLEIGLAKKNGARFFPEKPHFSTTDLKASDVYKQHFLKQTEVVLSEARRKMNSDDNLFFSSAFSVKAKLLPELKTELRDLLLRYVDTSEVASGDKVVSLICALH